MPGLKYDFSIAMGVRYGDHKRKDQLNKLITENADAIQQIMTEEAKIPTRLICNADLVTPAGISQSGSEERISLISSGTVIQNNISDPYEI